jgi:hypothetical protein
VVDISKYERGETNRTDVSPRLTMISAVIIAYTCSE